MARVVVTPVLIDEAVEGIKSNMHEYKKLSKEVRSIMSTLSCWSGDDKTFFCQNADKNMQSIEKLIKVIDEYNSTIIKCLQKYSDCSDATVNKLKTV